MNRFGKPLIIIGAITLLVALNMDVSVESGYGRVNNIGLMADRSKYLLLGALLVVAGLFVNFKNSENQSTDNTSNSDEIKCPFCAELIKKDAKLCKHCKSTIPEAQTPIPTINIAPNQDTNPTQVLGSEPPPAKSPPLVSPKVNRSEFNRSFTEEFSTPLNFDEIRTILANELSNSIKGFQKDSLLYFQGKSIYAEATLSHIDGKKWFVKIDYLEEMSTWSSIGILLVAIVISAITNSYTAFGLLLIIGPIIIILRAIFSSRLNTKTIKISIESFKKSLQENSIPIAGRPRSHIELTSSDTYALKLVTTGNHEKEVKAAIREILELGINDTNDLIKNQPCIIASGLSASEITTIKYKLMKAGASVEIENC
ncbi:ribosomal protein L7/L12 [Dechloromonas denitrificans]|uniref:ribosomal protein L7/L12 n=1 Tax=Dechloromonas denitrificans TaxID=281362 RepID=UPI001CF8FB19|nr:ribosomal protein L7/L12 [Dechloromonas denitrificans]UCV10824.1 ribosomal protein L7/L12 [Dechloromonas denitrificans]